MRYHVERGIIFRHINWAIGLLLALLAPCHFGSTAFAQEQNKPAVAQDQSKPAMTIVLDRGDLRAGETIGLHVWIENPTNAPLTGVRFRYVGPDFVKLGTLGADMVCAVNTA